MLSNPLYGRAPVVDACSSSEVPADVSLDSFHEFGDPFPVEETVTPEEKDSHRSLREFL